MANMNAYLRMERYAACEGQGRCCELRCRGGSQGEGSARLAFWRSGVVRRETGSVAEGE